MGVLGYRDGVGCSWGRTLSPVAIVSLVLIAGCAKPTPGVTLQSGARVVRSSATVYLQDGTQIRGSGSVKVLRARAGASVGIDVDHAIAARGWSVHITTRTTDPTTLPTTLDSSVLTGQHHFAFDIGSATTDIVVSELGTGTIPQGLWLFSIQPTLP